MKILRLDLDAPFNTPLSLDVLALGNFDGVHLGHRQVLEFAKAKSSGGDIGALIFDPHPRKFFAGDEFSNVYSQKDNLSILKDLGLDLVVFLKFDSMTAKLDPLKFLNLLFNSIQAQEYVVGYDFRFGRGRAGTTEMFENWCDEQGLSFSAVDRVGQKDGDKISSSIIKDCLKKGLVDVANKFLGDPFFCESDVFREKGLGGELGFPTINQEAATGLLPKGVYFTQVSMSGRKYPAISNLGVRPTVSSSKRLVLETHILEGFECLQRDRGEVDSLKVEFLKYLRPEMKFDSLENLKSQIQVDIKKGREFYSLPKSPV